MRHMKHPLVIVIGAVVLLLVVRAIAAFCTWANVSSADQHHFLQYLWIETLVDIAICLAAGGAFAWSAHLTAVVDSERKRLEHLAQVAVLAGGLAHEIRNHLNAFGTCLSLLRKSARQPDGELLGGIEKLEQVVTELDELLTNFLTLARPLRDKLEQVDLEELAKEVVEFLAIDLEQAHVAVWVEAASGVSPIIGDRGKLRRVILNLLVNARQAMPQGGTVVVRLSARGGQVQLDVEDNGCGIPPVEQPRVFEAFFSTKEEGTGLGLAVVKRTVEDLGGEISFESRPGCGTTFHIMLPNALQHEAAMRRLGRRPSYGRGPSAQNGPVGIR